MLMYMLARVSNFVCFILSLVLSLANLECLEF